MTSRNKSFGKFSLVLVFGIVVSALFTFLGTPILRVLRNVFGSRYYWLSGFAVSGLLLAIDPGLVLVAFMLLSFWVTVGIYQELEEAGKASFYAGLFSSLIGTLVMICGPFLFSSLIGLNLGDEIKKSFEDMLKQLVGGKDLAEIGLNVDVIMSQIPSMVAVVQISCLGFALMFDRRMAAMFGLKYENISTRLKLLEFKVPNYLIWVTMISFLLSFLGGIPAVISKVSLNVFITLMGIYFFQGLAVVEFLFIVLRTGAILKALIYLLIIGQLFLLLSLVGLIDFWADFRLRIKRWRMSGNNQNDGENV